MAATHRLLDAGQRIEAKMLVLIRPARAAVAAGHLWVDLTDGGRPPAGFDACEAHMLAIPLGEVMGLA